METGYGGLLSVIVPVYNAKPYLHQCVDSILRQTYSQLDILLVDDGSTDGSGKICDEYGLFDSRVRVIHQANKGLMKARKIGVEQAEGTYVTFVDADDWIGQDTYASMIMHGKGCDVTVCGIYRYYSSRVIKQELPGYAEGYYDRQSIQARIVPDMLWKKEINRWNLDPSLCTKIFKKEPLRKAYGRASGLNCYFGEDTAIIFPLMLKIGSIRILPEYHYYHRQRGEGKIPAYIRDDSFFDQTYQLYQYLKSEFMQSGSWDVMKNQLEHFYLNALERKKDCFQEASGELYPVFPFEEIPRGASVILYGAGEVGRKYMEQNEENHFCDIVMWVDRNYQNIRIPGYHIDSPEKIKHARYDCIVIAIDVREAAAKVKESLEGCGVPGRRIIWHSVRRDSF